jgi:hypothetical protein
VLGLGAEVVVPGHGEPTGAEFAATQRAELAELATLCRAVAERRLPPDEAVLRSPYPEATTRVAMARVCSPGDAISSRPQ